MNPIEKLLKDNEKVPSRAHQVVGVQQLVEDVDGSRGRTIPRAFALFDEVGAGKTKQCVDAAQILWQRGRHDTVVVIAPGFARSTWASPDPALGEVAAHCWDAVPNVVHEYHGDYSELDLTARALHWVVTNYEFVRRDERLESLLRQLRGRRTWLILDESWAVKGYSDQMRACWRLRRKRADRVTILNGTPLADGKPTDLYYQFAILDPEIIAVKNRTHFKNRYCILGGQSGHSVVDYQNLDELNAKVAPYVLSRRTRDCFDLPPMLPPVTVEARLSDATWKIYRAMRDEMVAWLGGQASVSRQAVVRVLRLSQITSGFLGGLEDVDSDLEGAPASELSLGPVPQFLRSVVDEPAKTTTSQVSAFGGPFDTAPLQPSGKTVTCREVGSEKLDAFLHYLSVTNRPRNLLVWCRFRPELERTTKALGKFYPRVLNLKGGQSKEDREAAKRLLAPGSQLPGAVVGIQKAGGASLNFAAANVAVYLSNGPALLERTQSIGRIERPGATQPMTIVDVVATGPKGQKTVDHHTLKALRAKEDMAIWTVEQWRSMLKDE